MMFAVIQFFQLPGNGYELVLNSIFVILKN
jgi:hypothetical protein